MASAENNALEKNSIPSRIRLVVVDDNEMFLYTFVRHLKAKNHLEIIGSATNARDGFGLIKELRPDLAVIDIQMPVINGLELMSWVQQQVPGVCIIAMTLYSDLAYEKAALKRGAHAFIRKENISDELDPLITKLSKDGCFSHTST